MDGWKLLLTAQELDDMVTKVAKKIDLVCVGRELVLVCILKGSAYFTVDLSRELTIKHTIEFVRAKSYDGQKRKALSLTQHDLNPADFEGKKVVLVDELLDSGHTLLGIKSVFLEFMKPEDIMTCVAMDKKLTDDKEKVLEADIVGMDVPDVWLVGYGLDDHGYYRNSRNVYAVPKKDGLPKTKDDILVFGE